MYVFLIIIFIFVSRILDNTPIQCEHGKVPVSNIGSMKRVSATAWTKLFSKVQKVSFSCSSLFFLLLRTSSEPWMKKFKSIYCMSIRSNSELFRGLDTNM